jgi:hypothetical protein
MRTVFLYIISVLILLILTIIFLGIFGYYDFSINFTLNKGLGESLLILLGISIGGPFVILLSQNFIYSLLNIFRPRFLRLANNLQRKIKGGQIFSGAVGIPQKKEMVANKMQKIWEKADMQYPLLELDFDKMKGGKSNS